MGGLPVVLADTNAIIEAVRTNCWAGLAGRFKVETVQECYEEALRRDPSAERYVVVEVAQLSLLATVHDVSRLERAQLALAYALVDALDDGERDLFAHAYGRSDEGWLLCSPDKATIRAAVALNWGDRLASLEELARRAGVRPKPSLYDQFTEARLVQWRTQARLKVL